MKTLLKIIVAAGAVMLCLPILVIAQDNPATANAVSDTFDRIVTSGAAVVTLLLGIYEVVVRVFPTVKDISILGNVIKVLGITSDLLNKKKKSGNTNV